jgi:hypothetical protein
MISLFRLLSSVFLAALLISCVSPGKQPTEESGFESQGKFPAWRIDNPFEHEAINDLLSEVDALIEANALDAAEDKLERVLRVKSSYAPAWSRLSWLALEVGSPKRAIQMAKRSNSFAYGNIDLQSLNWSFIRDASQLLGDEESYQRATQKIESFQSL